MSNSSGLHFPDMSEDGSSLLQDLSLVSFGNSAQQHALIWPYFRIRPPSRLLVGTRLETPPWACWTRTPSRTSLRSLTTTCPRRTSSHQPTTCLSASTFSQVGCRRVSPRSLSVTPRRRRGRRRPEWRRGREVAGSPGTRSSRQTPGSNLNCRRSDEGEIGNVFKNTFFILI